METLTGSIPSEAGSQRQIELIAMVIFRISAISFTIYAIECLCHLAMDLRQYAELKNPEKYETKYAFDMIDLYLLSSILNASVAVVFLFFNRRLARWVCRGLLKA